MRSRFWGFVGLSPEIVNPRVPRGSEKRKKIDFSRKCFPDILLCVLLLQSDIFYTTFSIEKMYRSVYHRIGFSKNVISEGSEVRSVRKRGLKSIENVFFLARNRFRPPSSKTGFPDPPRSTFFRPRGDPARTDFAIRPDCNLRSISQSGPIAIFQCESRFAGMTFLRVSKLQSERSVPESISEVKKSDLSE